MSESGREYRPFRGRQCREDFDFEKGMETMTEKTPVQITITPLLIGADLVAVVCGVSRRCIYQWDARGRIGPEPFRHLCRRVLWRKSDIDAWAAAGFPCRAEWLELQKDITNE